MIDLPASLYSEEQIRQAERLCIEKYGISGFQLMCRAGQAALEALQTHWEEITSIAVCIGTGNNGGDGLVLARLAKAKGMNVYVYQVGEVKEDRLSSEAKQARQDWLQAGGEIIPFTADNILGEVIVDAILGIGAKHPLTEPFDRAIRAINQSAIPVFALDLPSGLDPNTGWCEEPVIQAQATITFLAMKVGMATGNAIDKIGELYCDNLGVSRDVYIDVAPVAYRLIYENWIDKLPKRRPTSHKGDHGHVCVVGGGEPGFSGAVCLAGEAALRTGSGLVSAVVAPESLPLMARAPMELMCHGLKTPKDMQPLFEKANAVVLGPGLGQTSWSKKFFHAAIACGKPMIVDADGLNWLAKKPHKQQNWILTPHPKEAARLLSVTTQDIQKDRITAARKLADKFGGVIVLKGAGTIIVDEQQQLTIQDGGYPNLGTAGTGDVLAGILGSLVGQGLALGTAANIGVSVHSDAAELEKSLGERGMLASDLFLHIRSLINPFEK